MWHLIEIYTNTEFLNINEINILESVKNTTPVRINLQGVIIMQKEIAIFSPMEIYYQEEFQLYTKLHQRIPNMLTILLTGLFSAIFKFRNCVVK